MKLGPVTKPDKRNKTTSKKFDNDVISPNFCKTNAENSKIKAILVLKGKFIETAIPQSHSQTAFDDIIHHFHNPC